VLALSIVVPAYNEAERITPTLREIAAWLAAQKIDGEILVVDDGSSDGTCDVTRTLAREIPNLELVSCSPNRGKGFVVRRGMLAARGARRLYMDADNATRISELPILESALDRGADVAIGSRRAPGAKLLMDQPWLRRACSRAAGQVIRAVVLDGIRDTQCGFKLFTAAAAEAIFARVRTVGWSVDLEILVVARKLGFTIAEQGVTWSHDQRSRLNPLRDSLRIASELVEISRAQRRGEYDR
jgi:glycosyltransferase involved in cell wall biosynthesis